MNEALQRIKQCARRLRQFNAEIAELTVVDKFRELREYDLSRKPPVELLLDLSSDSQLKKKSSISSTIP